MILEQQDRRLLQELAGDARRLLQALTLLVEAITPNRGGGDDRPPSGDHGRESEGRDIPTPQRAAPGRPKCSRCHRQNDAEGYATCATCRADKAAARRAERAEGQSCGQRRAEPQGRPNGSLCTTDSPSTSAPSGSPRGGQRAEGGQSRGQKGQKGPAAPETESQQQTQKEEEALATALRTSPSLYARLAVRPLTRKLFAAGIRAPLVQRLIDLDRERAGERGALLTHWLKGGAGAIHDVLAEQVMKSDQVAAIARGSDAARPADEVARGEPAGFGTTPQLAASVAKQVLPHRRRAT